MSEQHTPEIETTATAAQVLAQGGLVAYPTEAVYGIGCDPKNEAAILRLLKLKRRPTSKGLILIAADISQLDSWIGSLKTHERIRIYATWPGPVTWVVPAGPAVTPLLCGQSHGIAVRVTDHPLAAALCRDFGGALVSTSANRSGEPPARDIDSVREQFGPQIDYYLPGPLGGRDRPSEIRDALSGAVLRS